MSCVRVSKERWRWEISTASIAQLGRVGQILHRLLHGADVCVAVLHTDPDHVAVAADSRPDVLQSVVR